jgi:hypothetical protein
VRRGADATQALTGVRAMPHSYQRTVRLSTQGLAPGDYDALLIGDDAKVLKRNAFTIAPRDARPEVIAIEAALRAGAPVKVRWRAAPGDLRDWIGLYPAGETDVTQYLGFVYTEALFAGEAVLLPDDDHRPLPPGEYELRLLHDESYVVLASARFSVLP